MVTKEDIKVGNFTIIGVLKKGAVAYYHQKNSKQYETLHIFIEELEGPGLQWHFDEVTGLSWWSS